MIFLCIWLSVRNTCSAQGTKAGFDLWVRLKKDAALQHTVFTGESMDRELADQITRLKESQTQLKQLRMHGHIYIT